MIYVVYWYNQYESEGEPIGYCLTEEEAKNVCSQAKGYYYMAVEQWETGKSAEETLKKYLKRK